MDAWLLHRHHGRHRQTHRANPFGRRGSETTTWRLASGLAAAGRAIRLHFEACPAFPMVKKGRSRTFATTKFANACTNAARVNPPSASKFYQGTASPHTLSAPPPPPSTAFPSPAHTTTASHGRGQAATGGHAQPRAVTGEIRRPRAPTGAHQQPRAATGRHGPPQGAMGNVD